MGFDLLVDEICIRLEYPRPSEPAAVRGVLQAAGLGPAIRNAIMLPQPQGMGISRYGYKCGERDCLLGSVIGSQNVRSLSFMVFRKTILTLFLPSDLLTIMPSHTFPHSHSVDELRALQRADLQGPALELSDMQASALARALQVCG